MPGAVFLSASLPNANQPAFMEWGVHPRAVDEAVTALTACVLKRGMRLVFGGHPSISPLVAMAALQSSLYPGLQSAPGTPDARPIIIYQSEAYRGRLPDETWALFRAGVAEIVWTGVADDDDDRHGKSLVVMRDRMLAETRPLAMVCVGGMQGVLDEVDCFRRHRRAAADQVYTLPGTGGAAAQLATQRDDVRRVGGRAEPSGQAAGAIPYPFLLSRLIDDIARRESSDG